MFQDEATASSTFQLFSVDISQRQTASSNLNTKRDGLVLGSQEYFLTRDGTVETSELFI